MGEAIVADVGADPRGAASPRSAPSRLEPRRPRRSATARREAPEARPDQRHRGDGRARLGLPRRRDRRARGAVEHAGAAQPAAPLAARLATTSAPAAGSASASPPRSACSSRSPTGRSSASSARARPSTRSPRFWSAVAYEVPVTFLVLRNAEYAILKWFSLAEGVEGAPGLDLPAARRRRGRRGLRRRRRSGSRAPRSCAPRSASRSAPAGPSAGRGRGRARHVARLLGEAGRLQWAVADPRPQRIAPRRRRSRAPDRAPDWVAARHARAAALASSSAARRRPGALPGPATSSATPPTRAPTGCSRRRWCWPRDDARRRAADGASRAERGIPLVFRAGGTSLNGQAQSDGILVDVRRHWRGRRGPRGRRRAPASGPGTILGHANRVLAPHGTQARPRPGLDRHRDASAASSPTTPAGCAAGRPRTPTRRVRSLTLRAAVGDRRSTPPTPDAAERFARGGAGAGARASREIRDEIRGDADLRERIRRKFEIKNTMGYRLCAFLDADEPLEIFRRLLVGSRGDARLRRRGDRSRPCRCRR